MTNNPRLWSAAWWVLAILLFIALPSLASTGLQEVYREVLPNGVTIILKENHVRPLVSLNIFIRAGSRYEDERTNGISHFYEHLFFRGTLVRSGMKMKKEIEGLGGQANAETTKDFTHYFINLPGKYVYAAMAILLDALLNTSLDPQEIAQERKVLLDEYKMNQESPSHLIQNKIFALAFRSHPYRFPIIGKQENLERFSREDFLAFKERFYCPRRTIIVVVGDFSKDMMLKFLRSSLHGFSASGPDPPEAPREPEQTEIRELEEEADLKNCVLSIAFRAPGVRDRPDIYAMDVLTFLLGQGRGSLLNRELVEKKKIAMNIQADFLTQQDPGLLIITATVRPENLKQGREEIFSLLSQLKSGGFSLEDFTRAKALLTSTFLFDNESNAGKAGSLGYYEIIDHMEFAQTYLDEIRKVDKKDIIRIAQRYLSRGYCSLVVKPRSRNER